MSFAFLDLHQMLLGSARYHASNFLGWWLHGESIKAAPDGLFGRAIVRYGQQRYWRTDTKGSCVLCVTACTGG